MSAVSEETLLVSGVLLAKVFGNQGRDIGRYRRENQRLADLEVRQQMIGQGFYAVVQSFLSITPAAVYLIAGLLLANGQPISAGTIVAFTTLQTRLYFPIGQLLQVSVELRSSLALFDRIFEYLDLKPDITDAPGAVDLPSADGGGRVALRDVYFRYSGVSEDALRGVSFEADPGPGDAPRLAGRAPGAARSAARGGGRARGVGAGGQQLAMADLIARGRRAGVALQGLHADGYWREPGGDRPAALIIGYATPPPHAWSRALEALAEVVQEV